MFTEKLIIFDYSGTLSLESTLFAQPRRLMEQLSESGLMDMGIKSPALFWDEIVNPTWREGSTTSAGYKKVIEDRVSAIFYQNRSVVPHVKISEAASLFVDSYLSHSRIDHRWQPILSNISRHPSVRVIIATDHYAEATGYILRFLNEFRIRAMAAKEAFADPGSMQIVVACSSDLGVHKADLRFWEIIKTGLNMKAIRNILLIDDFGCNEQKGDSYGAKEKVEQRKHDTETLLREVFSAHVRTIPFIIEGQNREKIVDDLITQTSAIIERFLSVADDG